MIKSEIVEICFHAFQLANTLRSSECFNNLIPTSPTSINPTQLQPILASYLHLQTSLDLSQPYLATPKIKQPYTAGGEGGIRLGLGVTIVGEGKIITQIE